MGTVTTSFVPKCDEKGREETWDRLKPLFYFLDCVQELD